MKNATKSESQTQLRKRIKTLEGRLSELQKEPSPDLADSSGPHHGPPDPQIVGLERQIEEARAQLKLQKKRR